MFFVKRKWLFLLLLVGQTAAAQYVYNPVADHWVDSVFKTLTRDQKIAQLMVVRLSTIGPNHTVHFFDKETEDAIRKYNIGGICLFQGGPLQQASLINHYQIIAKTPILFCIDAENGVGMRLDSVKGLPHQMMLGAVQDSSLIYRYGQLVGEQCKRMGIQVNYAPVVDVNNNPNNPVINDRSFGEDKYKVGLYGVEYMKGMQDMGVMACAKHFPGHGDVSVDSHLDLPVINKSMAQLDSLELYPFRQMIHAGVASMMVAHLYIPAIDSRPHRATSISCNNVTDLLRIEMGFRGLTFTDALEMKGVSKFYPDGKASVESLIAGNDMLCLPGDIPNSIKRIKTAIRRKRLSWAAIDQHVKRVLYAKYHAGLADWHPVILRHLTEDLNKGVDAMRRDIAGRAITVLRNDDPAVFPLTPGKRVAYVGFGLKEDNAFAEQVRKAYQANVYYFDNSMTIAQATATLQLLRDRYDVVVIGVHNYNRYPANNFGISQTSLSLIKLIQEQFKTITMVFGNPYLIKNFCDSKVLVACYEDDPVTQEVAADLLRGRFEARGKLPVTVCESLPYGSGILPDHRLAVVPPDQLGFKADELKGIDSIVNDAIAKHAIPGAEVLVLKDGKIAYENTFGFQTYDSVEHVYPETIYDLASVTKIMATNLSVMKLYEEGKLDLQKTLGDYLPWVRGSNKAGLKIWDILLHQAGLKAWIPFYRETIDTTMDGLPMYSIYSRVPDSLHDVRVAQHLYLRNDWVDTMYARILESELGPHGKYVYSDNDFIFLGKVVQAITGKPLNEFAKEQFYDKLHLLTTGFLPRERFPVYDIAPTENERLFRHQLIHGDVHDPGAAMFGGCLVMPACSVMPTTWP